MTKHGKPVAPGVKKRTRTNARGKAKFRLRAKRRGRATISTPVCGARLRLTR